MWKSVRERINQESRTMQIEINTAIDTYECAISMLRAGFGDDYSKEHKKSWKDIASDMEDLLHLYIPDVARYVISDIRDN